MKWTNKKVAAALRAWAARLEAEHEPGEMFEGFACIARRSKGDEEDMVMIGKINLQDPHKVWSFEDRSDVFIDLASMLKLSAFGAEYYKAYGNLKRVVVEIEEE